ncbi:MAG: BatA domain-containing protein, partial [Verrucomicrobiales bacterium]
FVSPLLLWAGLIAVLAPIIIHLLNKRRFKRVDWAAMDFLLQAQKINKRRVKLEDLLLLLLRCLIMALIGLLLARPFFTFDSGVGLFKSARHERVILLDDSLSMNAQSAGITPLVMAGKAVTNWVTTLASNNADDSFTLLLASRPDRAVYRDEPLTEDGVNQILEDVKNLEVADASSQLPKALAEIEEMLDPSSGGGSVNRIVYVVSDFRARDWAPDTQKDVFESLKRIAEKSAGLYLVDAGGDAAGSADNVVIEEIVARDKALIAGVPSEFEVTVRNHGGSAVTDLSVKLTAGEMLPLERVIERIGPGETGAASFTFTFARPTDLSLLESVRLQAEIAPESGDALGDDDVRYFPARVTSGLKVLLIDGDPSSTYGESETFFLQKALAPRGRAISGLDLTVMDDSELDILPLGDYEVIFLANVYRLNDVARERLEAWVEDGGGLVVVLGDQIDEESYNNDLHRNGEGFLPVSLSGIRGDEDGNSWALLEPQNLSHPILQLFEGDGSPLLEGVKLFQWWGSTVPQTTLDSGQVNVIASLSDEEKSPLLLESTFGEGRVMTVMSSLDLDWNNWPAEAASYLIMLQEMTRHMAPKSSGAGVFPVGGVLSHELELTEFRPDGAVITPTGSSIPLRALPKTGGEQSTPLEKHFGDTTRRGFY